MESMWFIYVVLFIVIFMQLRQDNLIIVRKHLRSKKGKMDMTEMINKFIGKECLIYTCTSSSTVTGVIRSYNDGWIEVERDGVCDIMNCEYILRIREYPKNKNGKRKSVVFD